MPSDKTASQTPVALDKFPDMALPALYRAAIGAINTTYYLKLFTHFEARGSVGLSWNWAACLCTVNWLLFRKMVSPLVTYLMTVVMVLVSATATGRLILYWTPAVEISTWITVAAVLFVLPGVVANGLYYRQCRRNIERAIQLSPTLEGACQSLAAQASTRTRLLRLAAVNLGVLGIGLLLAMTLSNRTPVTENPEDTAPAPVRRSASAAGFASPIEPVSAAAEQTTTPVAPISVPMPPAIVASVPTLPPPAPPAPSSLPTAVARAPTPTPTPPGHYINVGLFADPDNARRAYVKLVKSGLLASREVMVVRQKKVTRVRSGPYDSLAKAQSAVARIKALQLDAVLAKPKATDSIASQTTPNRP